MSSVTNAATGEYVDGTSHFFRGHFCVMQDTRRGPLTLLRGRGGLSTYSGRGGYDGIIVIEEWDRRRRQTLPDRGRRSGLARFSIDGRRIATTNGTHVDLYQLLPEPGRVGTVDLSLLGDPVEVMSLSEDGAVVAVGTRRGRVLVFVVEG